MENIKARVIQAAIWIGSIALLLLVFVGKQESADFVLWVFHLFRDLFDGIKTVIVTVKNGA